MINSRHSIVQNTDDNHLEVINGIKFTPREIDIISCLISGRAPKVIASFLSISPRTIETHIRNIMLKLECNSREGIINFIEKTDKVSVIKERYLGLLSEFTFKQKLHEISKQIKHDKSSVLLISEDDSFSTSLAQQLDKHFNLVGINLQVKVREKGKKIASLIEDKEKGPFEYFLYIASQEIIGLNLMEEEKQIISLLQKNDEKPGSVIFLTLDKPLAAFIHKKLEKAACINFGEDENYYFSFFDILKKIISDDKLKQIIADFKEISSSSYSPYTTLLRYMGGHENNTDATTLFPLLRVKKYSKFLRWIGFFSLVVLVFAVPLLWLRKPTQIGGGNSAYSIRSDLSIPTKSTLLDRSYQLSQIEEKLNKKKGIQTIALIGIGGAGKSTLARRYARSQQVSVVWEINAETKESLIHSFESFAYALCKEEQEKKELRAILEMKTAKIREEKLFLFVKSRLRRHDNWLLVYNDLNNFYQLQTYIPRDENTWGEGRVIITTSDSNIEGNSYIDGSLHIGELTPADKLTLFTKIMDNGGETLSSSSSNEQTKAFLNNLPPFPLDISIAAYYLKTTQISYDKYLEYLKDYDEDFAAVQERILKGANYSRTRYSIVALSLKSIIEADEDFTELLLLTSLLTSQDIPRALLESHKDEVVVDNFIYNLRKYSLLTKGVGKLSQSFPTLSMHKSAQGISLAYLTKKLQLNGNNPSLKAVAHTLEKYASTIIAGEDFFRMKILSRHCEMFLKHPVLENNNFTDAIKAKLGIIYFYLGNYLESKKILEESLKNLSRELPENNYRISNILTHLGMVYRKLGNYEKARDLLEEGMRGYRTHYPKSYADIAQSLRYLGMVRKSLGDYEKAKKLFEESLQIYITHLSNKHCGFAWSLGSLGVVNRKLGNYEKARDLLTQSLEIYKEHYPGNHGGLAWTLTHLGRVYMYLGDYKKAKELFEEGLQIYTTHLSEDNVRVSWVLGPLGVVFCELQDYVKAEQLLEQILAVYRHNLPEDHISVAWATSHLGTVHRHTGKYETAKKLLNKSLRDYAKHFGKNHIENGRILMELGKVYSMEGNLDLAENLINQSLDLYLQNKHPKVYIALECLADLQIKRLNEAIKAKEISQASNHRKRAIDCLTQALDIVKIHFSAKSPHRKRIQTKMETLQ